MPIKKHNWKAILLFLVGAVFLWPIAADAGVLFGYVASPGYGTMDPVTGATNVLATLPVNSLNGATYDPATNTYYDFVGTGSAFGFYKINAQTGANSFVQTSGSSEMQFASATGKLFGYIGSGEYGTMDPVTGATSTLATLAVNSLHGATYDPATNTYYDFAGTGATFGFYKINAQTGTNSFVQTSGSSDMQFASDTGQLFGLIGPDQYGTMDPATGATTVLAALSVNSTHGATYDPATKTYYDFVGTQSGAFGFYEINAQTGANSFVQTSGSSEMQFVPEPSAPLFLLLLLFGNAACARRKSSF